LDSTQSWNKFRANQTLAASDYRDAEVISVYTQECDGELSDFDVGLCLKSQILKGATVGVALRGHPFRSKCSSFDQRVATEGHPYSCSCKDLILLRQSIDVETKSLGFSIRLICQRCLKTRGAQ